MFRFDADSGDPLWADFPSIGFNKNWVVVSCNMHTLTGTPGAPSLTIGATKSIINQFGAWTQPGNEILPQAPEVGGSGTRKLVSGDAQIQNFVFRSGGIYYCQTIGLPSGGTINRTAAQWVQLKPRP